MPRITSILCILATLWATTVPYVAYAKNNGHWKANSDPAVHDAINNAKNKDGGLCCAELDGTHVERGDVEQQLDGYHVWIPSLNQEIVVPPEAMVTDALVPLMIWYGTDGNGKIFVRCFSPGALGMLPPDSDHLLQFVSVLLTKETEVA